MDPECRRQLREMAIASPVREICGFIMNGWWPQPISNVARADREFYMDEDQLLHMYVEHRSDIIGVYHSHPSGLTHPSDSDVTFAPPGMRYWVVTTEEVTEWEIRDGHARQVLVDEVCVTPAEVRSIPVPRAEQSCC